MSRKLTLNIIIFLLKLVIFKRELFKAGLSADFRSEKIKNFSKC